MRGSAESLVKRAGLVVSDACTMSGRPPGEMRGGLVIYCGGCMLHVRDRMDDVVDEVRRAMPGAPFLGAFTFGEQGAIVDNCHRNGNLMVSALTFGCCAMVELEQLPPAMALAEQIAARRHPSRAG